jgi:hypothetical protein
VLARGDRSYWLGGQSQALRGSFGVLLQGGLVELATIATQPLPLFGEGPLTASASATYLREEKQGVTGVQLWWMHSKEATVPAYDKKGERDGTATLGAGYTLGTDASMEWNSPRLRHVRVQADAFFRAGLLPGKISFPCVIDWHVYAEATTFDSAFFEQTTGEKRVLGGGVGLRGMQGLRVGSVVFDLYGGVNRPETLALVPQAVGHGEVRMQMFFRLGW